MRNICAFSFARCHPSLQGKTTQQLKKHVLEGEPTGSIRFKHSNIIANNL